MAEEIVTLKVKTEGDKDALNRLNELDKMVAKLNRRRVTIKVDGLKNFQKSAEDAAKGAASSILAFQSTALVPLQTQLTQIEGQFQSAQKSAQGFQNTAQNAFRLPQPPLALNSPDWMLPTPIQDMTNYNALWGALNQYMIRPFVRHLREATDELKAMNKELVAVQKVTKASDVEMAKMKEDAFQVASALGSTPSDYLSSVTKWAQAGYQGLSAALGELSAKTQVVGNVSEETANKFLLAVDAAYKYEGNVDQLTRVLDGANEIGNQFATSVEKMAGGMGIVSSLAAQAGMKVEETVAAIGTITAVTQESGNSAARALRALILNIQGKTEIEIDAETGERWSEDEIQRTAAALNELNIATREYKDGVAALRNPMEVIGELSEKYRKGLISEVELQEVVSSLGGKVRSNQLMALISNYEMYTEMLETYKDSVGSADRELDIYLKGWEAKSKKLTAQWAQFIEGFKATDLAIGMLDLGSAMMKLADTPAGRIRALAAALVVLNVALRALSKTAGMQALGASFLTTFTAIKGIIPNMINGAKAGAAAYTGMAAAAHGAAGGATALLGSLKAILGPIGIVILVVGTLAAAYEHFAKGATRAAKALADAKEEYEQSAAKVESLQEELKTAQERMDELNRKGSLTVLEQEELDKLKEQTQELKRQLVIEEKIAKAKREALDAAAQEALEKGFSGADLSWWKRLAAGFTDTFEDNVLSSIQGKGFQEAADLLMDNLNWLNQEKEKFLAGKPDASTWTDGEKRKMEDLDNQLKGYQAVANDVYNDLISNANNLSDEKQEQKDYWIGIADALWAATNPAEALTEKLNRLVDAMEEAERTRFNEALSAIQGDGKVTAQEVQSLIDRFPVLKQLLDENGGALDTLARYFTEATQATQENTDATRENANAQEEEAKEWDEVATQLKKYAGQAQDVVSAQEELKKNGELSFDTLVGLLGKYGNAVNDVVLKALNGMATQEEISKALEIAYEKDVQDYRNAMLEKEMDKKDFYTAWLKGNADTVKALAEQYGIDAGAYQTLAQLKLAIEEAEQKAETTLVRKGANDRIDIFREVRNEFYSTHDDMLQKAGETVVQISNAYRLLKMPNIGRISAMKTGGSGEGWEKVLDTFNASLKNLGKSTASKAAKSSGSSKSWYETQIDNLKKLEDAAKRTNQVLERSDGDTSRQRIKNLRDLQARALALEKQFIARGKSAASDEVNQIKLLYHGLEDEIEDIYKSLSDSLLVRHKQTVEDFEDLADNPRTMEQIAADDAAMVEKYRQMQIEVHALAEYYREQGVKNNDALIRDLQQAWRDYAKAIRSIYENLTDAFRDYIDESSHQIEALGRTTGQVGRQIELYAQRIQKARETMALLQSKNSAGALDEDIQDLESQIWEDQDAVRDLQEGLWDELERAFDDIFDKVQEDIDAIGDEIEGIQDQMDEINDVLDRYDKELEGILKPINDTLDKLNDQLEAEKKRLEAITDPLNQQKQALEDQISGYYTVNPDGTIGAYVPGLDDQIDGIQDQLDGLNEELDRVNDAWNEQKKREEEALALQKKQLAVEEAQKAVEDALLALQTARNERNIYTLKDGVWAWRADEEAVAKAEKALTDAEKAKEEAEKELQDYKEEQAHKQIVKRLEEQIKALEEQKKLLDRQKELIQKQITAISRQIDAFERESQARQDYIQNLIDQKEAEKEAWEDHYDALKEQYRQQLEALEEEKKAAEARKKEAEKQYDQWMDTWKDIQRSIETPARDISEILNDIAKYGTPAMAGQVDRVTELLRQLGYVLEDVTAGGGFDPDAGGSDGIVGDTGMTRREIIDRMLANTHAFPYASDEERNNLYKENQWLGAQIGAVWDDATSRWDIFDYSEWETKVQPWAYEGRNNDWQTGGYSARGLSLPDVQNDGLEEYKSRYGLLTTEDYAAPSLLAASAPTAVSNYSDDHSVTMNGVTIGSNMLHRPLSDTLQLVGLNMGT